MTSNKPTKRNVEQAYQEIITRSFDSDHVLHIDEVLWNRLSDANGMQWRHGYKSMLLLEVLMIRGSEACLANAFDHIRRLYAMVHYRAKDKTAAVQLKLVNAFTSGYDGEEKGRGQRVRKTAVRVLKTLHATSKIRLLRQKQYRNGKVGGGGGNKTTTTGRSTTTSSTTTSSTTTSTASNRMGSSVRSPLKRISVDFSAIKTDPLRRLNGENGEDGEDEVRKRMKNEVAEERKRENQKKKKGMKKVGYVLKKGAKGSVKGVKHGVTSSVKTVGRVGKLGVKGVQTLAGRMRWNSSSTGGGGGGGGGSGGGGSGSAEDGGEWMGENGEGEEFWGEEDGKQSSPLSSVTTFRSLHTLLSPAGGLDQEKLFVVVVSSKKKNGGEGKKKKEEEEANLRSRSWVEKRLKQTKERRESDGGEMMKETKEIKETTRETTEVTTKVTTKVKSTINADLLDLLGGSSVVPVEPAFTEFDTTTSFPSNGTGFDSSDSFFEDNGFASFGDEEAFANVSFTDAFTDEKEKIHTSKRTTKETKKIKEMSEKDFDDDAFEDGGEGFDNLNPDFEASVVKEATSQLAPTNPDLADLF